MCNCSLPASYLETCTLRILVRSIREPDPALKDEGPQRASGMRIREIRASPPDTIACCYSTGLKIRKEEYFSMDLSKKRDAHTRSLCLPWEGAAPLQLLHPVCACRNSSRSQPAHRPLTGSNCHLQWSTSEEKKKNTLLKSHQKSILRMTRIDVSILGDKSLTDCTQLKARVVCRKRQKKTLKDGF